jgi:hypothetical protein
MSSMKHDIMYFIDMAAFELQKIYTGGDKKRKNPLIGLDYGERAGRAPFQFDTTHGELHRTGCKFLKQDSKLSHFALWEIDEADLKLACDKCRPHPKGNAPVEKKEMSDMVLGLLSLVDQFGSALRERGAEYRNSERGKGLVTALDELSGEFSGKQQALFENALTGLDRLLTTMQKLGETMDTLSPADDTYDNKSDRPEC